MAKGKLLYRYFGLVTFIKATYTSKSAIVTTPNYGTFGL